MWLSLNIMFINRNHIIPSVWDGNIFFVLAHWEKSTTSHNKSFCLFLSLGFFWQWMKSSAETCPSPQELTVLHQHTTSHSFARAHPPLNIWTPVPGLVQPLVLCATWQEGSKRTDGEQRVSDAGARQEDDRLICLFWLHFKSTGGELCDDKKPCQVTEANEEEVVAPLRVWPFQAQLFSWASSAPSKSGALAFFFFFSARTHCDGFVSSSSLFLTSTDLRERRIDSGVHSSHPGSQSRVCQAAFS